MSGTASAISSMTTALSSTLASGITSSSAVPAESPTPTQPVGNTSPAAGSSPLLFFVALGFGVVFTNLWYVFDHFPTVLLLPSNVLFPLGLLSASSTAFDIMLVIAK